MGEPVDGIYRQGATPGSVVIERRWLRSKHYVMLLVFLALSGVAGFFWATDGYSVPLLLGTIVLTSWDYNLLTMFLNRTFIRADQRSIEVSHGPLPNLLFRPQSLPTPSVRQLFAVAEGGSFMVKAQLADGKETKVVWPLMSNEQAIFVEQQLERALGLVDFEVPGELNSALPAALAAPGEKGAAGGAALALIVPVTIAGALVMFFAMGASEVQGSLVAKGDTGTWTLTPDDCSSGQLSGFFGVELTSSAEPGKVVRLTRDPVRGNMLIVDEAGASRPKLVLDAAACERLNITVNRTSTSINDVWVVEGQASIACPGLTGDLTFSGCH